MNANTWYALLPQIVNMSLTASIVILAVLVVRLPLRKAPKVFSYGLWAAVLFRLLCPFSIPSGLSLLNLFDAPATEAGGMEYIPSNIVHMESPAVTLPVPGVSQVINGNLPQGGEQLAADPLEFPTSLLTYIWLAGILILVIYSAVQQVRLRRFLVGAAPLRGNLYLADHIPSPFVMGLVRPKIYLPSALSEGERPYVILHEEHHIRRGDHVFRLLAFAALCVHWFNPLVWLAFVLSGRDMEMSCDEAVMKQMSGDIRAAYSASLLRFAAGRKVIAGAPLAFGEGDTKGRIRNVMGYKKPAFWVVAAAVIVCIIAAVCLLTNPQTSDSLDDSSAALLEQAYQEALPLARELEGADPDGPISIETAQVLPYTDAAGAQVCDIEFPVQDSDYYVVVSYIWEEAGQTWTLTSVQELTARLEPPLDKAIERMASVTPDDLKYISGFSDITPEELAPVLNAAAEHQVEGEADIWMFWSADIYLSGGPEVYSSDDESMFLYAGLAENVVEIRYHDGAGSYEYVLVEDEPLYWLIRSSYSTGGTVDESLDQYRDIIGARAQISVDASEGVTGAGSFTGYEVVRFEQTDTFETEDARYDVYSYDLAFTVDDPTKVGWAGGMYLDGDLRVRGYEQCTYFVVRSDSAGRQDYRFLFWDLYLGPDEATGRETARETIQKAFDTAP